MSNVMLSTFSTNWCAMFSMPHKLLSVLSFVYIDFRMSHSRDIILTDDREITSDIFPVQEIRMVQNAAHMIMILRTAEIRLHAAWVEAATKLISSNFRAWWLSETWLNGRSPLKKCSKGNLEICFVKPKLMRMWNTQILQTKVPSHSSSQ